MKKYQIIIRTKIIFPITQRRKGHKIAEIKQPLVIDNIFCFRFELIRRVVVIGIKSVNKENMKNLPLGYSKLT